MKDFKLLLVSAALLLITAGVFAGAPKFSNDLYVSQDGVNFTKILAIGNFVQLQSTINGSQVSISDHVGAIYNLYYTNSSGARVYSTSNW